MMVVQIIRALTIPFAMVVVAVLVIFALDKNIDGAVFMTGLAIVGGLGGYEIKNVLEHRKKNGTPPTK